ncbi:p47 [Bacteriophage sp.]|nr:p47 [Bacteriophage sp.]
MPGESDFDMGAALADVSAGLGFEPDEPVVGGQTDDDLELNVDPPAGDAPLEPEAAPAPAPATSPAPPPGAPDLTTPPKTWRAEAAAEWAALSDRTKAEIHKREQDFFNGIEGYKADAVFAREVKTVLDPYMPILNQYGIDPKQQIAGLMNSHYTLATGAPEQKAALVKQIFKDYNLDPAAIFGLTAAEAPYMDPEVQRLQSEVQDVKSLLTARQQQEARQVEAENRAKVTAFASDPKNIHFKDVAGDMAALLNTKAARTLEEAYELAVYKNPVTRQAELTRLQTEQAAAAAKAAREAAEAARKATAANVRPKAKNGSGTAPTGSIDDTLAQTHAAIMSRGT